MSEQQSYLVRKLEDLHSKEIEKYVNVSIINIYFKKLDYIPVHIQVLKINKCSLQSLKNLCNLVGLRYLDIRDNLVNSISEIIIHQELTYLDIANNCVILIDPIAALRKLKTLLIGNNKIVNLEPLVHHENFDPAWVAPAQKPIQKEDVAQTLTPGSSEQKIAELIKAESKKKEYSDYLQKTITLVAPQVKNNVLTISNQTCITSLLFSDCLHIDTLLLNNCPNVSFEQLPVKIKHLSITNSRLIRLNGLEKMSQLESIDLSGNNLTKCELLAQLKKLKAINLTNNKIIDLKHIKQFIQFQNVLVSEQVKPGTSDFKKYLGQEGTEAQVQQLIIEMNENAVTNEEIIHDTQMLLKYKDKVNGGVLEINEDQELTSTEFSEYIGHTNQKKVTELRIISCYNMKLDRCPKQSVKSLTINKCHLKDINGIQVMTQLTQLNLSLNQISDISLLAQLTNLTALDLGQNNIESANVLSNFKQLVSLDLSENLITDISPLRDLLQMQILDVSYNKLQNINDLAALTNIRHLNITQTNISNIDSLAKMTKMTHLLMSSNKIISIQILKSFPELYDVRLENNFIQDFEPIAKHKFANKNWVREQKIPTETDFMNSFGCDQQDVTLLIKKSKQQKEMSDNKYMLIKKYEKDVKNTSLKINGEKQLNNLQFTDVLKLTELEAINSQTIHFAEDQVPSLLLKLKLNNCTFKNEHLNLNPITGIYQMEQLVELDLTSNRILDVSEIGNLTNLQKLYLQNNDIHRINELRSLAKLTHVNLSNNKIIFSEPLNQLKVELLIDNNLIADSVTYKNQQQPQLNHFKVFLGPNSSDDQINELTTVTSDIFYSVKMKSKYAQSVQNSALNIQNDAELEDFGFSTDLNIKLLSVKDCQNVKLPRILVNHLQGTIEKYQDVKPTKLPTQIASLSIVNSKLTNLNGLELLTQLQKIQLINNPITSFKSILGLSKVNSLTINSAKLTDFSGLNQMKQLVELDLGSNQIQEIDQIAEQLKGLANLKRFSVQNNNIHRVNALRGLQQLTYLNVSLNKIIFSEPLNQLKVELQIDNNLVTDNITLKNQQQPQLNHFKAFLGPNSSNDQISELSEHSQKNNYSLIMNQKYKNQVQNQTLTVQNDGNLTDFGFTSDLNVINLSLLNCQNVKMPSNVKYFKTVNGQFTDYPEVKVKVPAQIVSLTVNNCGINNLDGIEAIKQLQKLELINNLFNSIKPICLLVNVTQLTINGSKITNIEGIETMKQLQSLDLRDNSILSIEPLKQLVNLKQVSLDNNFIKNLEYITTLPNYKLEWIFVQKNPTDADYQNYINDTKSTLSVAQLKAQLTKYEIDMCTKFQPTINNQILSISNDNQIKDFKFVDQLPIVNLQLNNCNGLKFFRTPTNIISLTINNSKLTNLVGIEVMRQLQYLDIRDNSLVSIEPLKELVNLKQVLLDNNFIQNLEFVTALRNYKLEWIYYQKVPTDADYQNYINDTQSVQSVAQLKAALAPNKVQTDQLIAQLTKYETDLRTKYQPAIKNQILTINGDNQIKDFKFVDQLPIVNLQLNNCINVNLFRTPTKILSLTINNSRLTNLIGIEVMRQLQYLDIRDNSIISIQPLQHLINLKQLLIDNNFIQDLELLTVLPNYTVDWIYYQKVPNDADYQNFINSMQRNQTVNELKTELLRFKNKTEEIIQNGPAKYDREMVAKYRGSVRDQGYGQCLEVHNDANIRDLKFLEQLGAVDLRLYDCVNARLLRAPTNLVVLLAQNCNIKNITSVEKMTQIKYLYLENNKISDFSPIQSRQQSGKHCSITGQNPTQQEIDEAKLRIM
ncbi:Leucine_Rich repeats-containing protein [Hexamita inflata]|uniref:Leucine Rich repeats-containing protein n=1 Tax=Hexamita inflata TaxID=28002 RepID=A0AA86TVU7_9EUKA|nr:Leucine Rich repeats-containing protein [Hexamita inflata]